MQYWVSYFSIARSTHQWTEQKTCLSSPSPTGT